MVNKAIILGTLGRDPEARMTSGGTMVCTLSVATNRARKVDGGWAEETDWHRVSVFGKQAEACAKHLAKGRQVYVEGHIEYQKYEKDGVEKQQTVIIANEVKFVGGGKKKEDGESEW